MLWVLIIFLRRVLIAFSWPQKHKMLAYFEPLALHFSPHDTRWQKEQDGENECSHFVIGVSFPFLATDAWLMATKQDYLLWLFFSSMWNQGRAVAVSSDLRVRFSVRVSVCICNQCCCCCCWWWWCSFVVNGMHFHFRCHHKFFLSNCFVSTDSQTQMKHIDIIFNGFL